MAIHLEIAVFGLSMTDMAVGMVSALAKLIVLYPKLGPGSTAGV